MKFRSVLPSQMSRLVTCVASAVAAIVFLTPVSGVAQSSAGAQMQLEEILVTATRRGEGTDIQTTPVAVTAISEQDFSDLFAFDIGDTARLVPNFSAAKITAFNAAGFAIRGASQTDILSLTGRGRVKIGRNVQTRASKRLRW